MTKLRAPQPTLERSAQMLFLLARLNIFITIKTIDTKKNQPSLG